MPAVLETLIPFDASGQEVEDAWVNGDAKQTCGRSLSPPRRKRQLSPQARRGPPRNHGIQTISVDLLRCSHARLAGAAACSCAVFAEEYYHRRRNLHACGWNLHLHHQRHLTRRVRRRSRSRRAHRTIAAARRHNSSCSASSRCEEVNVRSKGRGNCTLV